MPAETTINLEPMPGKLIVEPFEPDERTAGGLYLARSAEHPSSIGKVVAIYSEFEDPDDHILVEPFIQLGDTVIFGRHSGVNLTINRKKYIILSEREILCRVLPETIDSKAEVEAV